jgi:hypothetical protein
MISWLQPQILLRFLQICLYSLICQVFMNDLLFFNDVNMLYIFKANFLFGNIGSPGYPEIILYSYKSSVPFCALALFMSQSKQGLNF